MHLDLFFLLLTGSPMKDGVLIKQAFKLLYSNLSLYRNVSLH